MTVQKYRKKPVVIEAIRWDGTEEAGLRTRHWVEREHNSGAIVDTKYIGHLWDYEIGAYVLTSGKTIFAPYGERCLIVMTLEGEMVARPGWWIIRGVQGEFYPCDPDVFAQTYEEEAA